jgi:hypothetical protein
LSTLGFLFLIDSLPVSGLPGSLSDQIKKSRALEALKGLIWGPTKPLRAL